MAEIVDKPFRVRFSQSSSVWCVRVIHQGVPLTDIANICRQPPNLADMQDIPDVCHIFMIKVWYFTKSTAVSVRLSHSHSNTTCQDPIGNLNQFMVRIIMSTNGTTIMFVYLAHGSI